MSRPLFTIGNMLGRGAAVRPILPGVVQVPLTGSSVFLLLDRRITLIDAGVRGSTSRLLNALRLAGRSAEEIERIIITHYHPDHLGGLAALQRLLPAKTAIHALEAPAVTGRAGPPSPFANAALRVVAGPLLRAALPFTPVRIDEVLHDGDELPVLGGLRVVHTPGHTPGHIALYFPEMALLIAGDAMERRRGALSGPARAVTADMGEARRSIRSMAELEVEVIVFSHFPRLAQRAGERLRDLASRV
jgi:glyoxylase-like metal-dependent hydrolase (beta-lactamase superfamily II)